MKYQPGPIADKDQLREYLRTELQALATVLNELDSYSLKFDELHAEPARRFTGLTVLADGTDWNPGSGAGVYTFYGAAWHKLG